MQKKSHEILLKVLNNIGIIGAILAAVADIICVIIFVYGVHIDINISSMIIFAVINAVIGILINVLLRYQGQKYAEIENEELCAKFHKKKAEKKKKYMSMTTWSGLSFLKDVIIKGCTTTFSICGVIYISIEGSHNPIMILISCATLVLFACFGLVSMNSAYCRFYNVQIPHMQLEVEKKENKIKGEEENGTL